MRFALLSFSVLVSTVAGAHPRDTFLRAKTRDPGVGVVANLEAGGVAPQRVHKRSSYSSPYLNNNTERS